MIPNNPHHPNFFSSCKTLCCVIDFEGAFHQINQEWEKTLGYDSNYLPNCLYLDLVHPEDQAITEATLHQLNANIESVVFTNRFLHYDGTYREILWQASRAEDESNCYAIGIEMPQVQQTTGIHLQQENIALHEQINQLETTLQQTKEFFELVMQSKKECLLEWDLNLDQVHYSHGWKNLLGNNDENLGTQINAWYSRIHPNDYSKVIKNVKNCLDGSTLRYENQHRLQHKDGSYRWVHSQGVMLLDSNNQASRFLITFTDITEYKRTEEALASSQKYEQLFAAQATATLLVDNQGAILDANPAALKIYNSPRETFLQLKTVDIFTTDLNLSSLNPNLIHTSYHNKLDGTTFPVEMTISSLMWAGKKRFVVTVRDVTGQDKATQIITESETRYRLLFEAESDAIVVFAAKTLKIFDINPAAMSLYGYSREEWLSLKMEDVLVAPSSTLVDLQRASKQPFHHIPLHWHKKKNGITFPVEISTGSYSFKDHTLVCAAIRDVTTRKQAEQTAHKAQVFTNALIQAAPVFFATFTPEGTISSCNETLLQALGYSLDEVIDQDYEMLLPEGERPLVAESISALLSQREKSTLLENTLLTKTGQELLVEWHANLVIDTEQKMTYILGVGIDISQRKKTQNQLRLFKRIVEVSHEAISISSPDGQLMYANPAHANLFKHSLRELREYNYRDYCTPESLHKIDHDIATSVKQGKTWEGILEVLDTQGQIFPVWGRFDVVRDEKDNILFSFGLMHDATKQQDLETSLRTELEQYEAIFHAAPLAIVYKDRENRIIRANRYFADWLDATSEKLQGLFFHDLIPEYAEQYYADDLEVINTGQAKLEIIEKYPKGYWQTDKIPYRDATSKLLGVISFSVDITNRIENEQNFQEKQKSLMISETRWRLVIENLPFMIIAVDTDNNIVLWNRKCEQVTGYPAAEIVGSPQAWELLYPNAIYREHLFRVAQDISKNYSNDNRWEWQLTCKDGTEKTIGWSLMNQSQIPGFLALGVGIEITEPQLINQRTSHAEEESFRQILQESVARMRFVIENLPIMVGALDEPGNIVFWNRYCEQVTGYMATEIIGNPQAWELLYPEETFRQKVLNIWQRVITTQRELHRFAMTLTCKDGTQKKIAWSTLSDQVKIEGWAVWGVGIDMTAHENILQEHKKRLKRLVTNLPIMVNAYNEQGQIILWNQHCEKLTGYQSAEVIKNSNTWTRIFQRPQHREHLQEKYWSKDDLVYETELTTKDGVHKIIAWSNLSKQFPVSGWNHWLIGEDITLRKVPSASNHENGSLVSIALNHIHVGICITEGSGKFVYMNQAFCLLHGVPVEELLDRQFTTLVPRNIRNQLTREYFSFLNGNSGNSLCKTHEALHADGYLFSVETTLFRAVPDMEQAYVVWLVTKS